MAARAGVTVVKPKNDFALLGDERRLVQSVVNLLSNAIKFSPRNSTITLSLERTTADDAPLVQMRISDQGPGIPEDDRALIFEKFSQSKASSNVSIKSTGLGLAIVKAIAFAHGGDVGIESEIGKGSTFWLSIPEFVDQEDEA
jgi:signal transduction histidine kinase